MHGPQGRGPSNQPVRRPGSTWIKSPSRPTRRRAVPSCSWTHDEVVALEVDDLLAAIDSSSQTLPPMTLCSPMRVSPPRIGGVGVDGDVVADVRVALDALDRVAVVVDLEGLRAERHAW